MLCLIFHLDERLNTTSFTLQAYIFPTTPDKGKQGILTKWNEKTQSGYGLFIDENSCLSVMIGDGGGQTTSVSSEKKLMRKVWYLVAATYDAETCFSIISCSHQIPNFSHQFLFT